MNIISQGEPIAMHMHIPPDDCKAVICMPYIVTSLFAQVIALSLPPGLLVCDPVHDPVTVVTYKNRVFALLNVTNRAAALGAIFKSLRTFGVMQFGWFDTAEGIWRDAAPDCRPALSAASPSFETVVKDALSWGEQIEAERQAFKEKLEHFKTLATKLVPPPHP